MVSFYSYFELFIENLFSKWVFSLQFIIFKLMPYLFFHVTGLWSSLSCFSLIQDGFFHFTCILYMGFPKDSHVQYVTCLKDNHVCCARQKNNVQGQKFQNLYESNGLQLLVYQIERWCLSGGRGSMKTWTKKLFKMPPQ